MWIVAAPRSLGGRLPDVTRRRTDGDRVPRAERPIDAEDGLVAEFAADLRRLREKAGKPPYRELARRAHFSSTTLADAAGGRKLPSLQVTLAYVRACGGDPEQWEARWHALTSELAAPDTGEASDAAASGCPYVGLSAFQAADADRFYGREKLTEDLVSMVGTERMVIVFGASGSGKSSLLRAGLIPAMGDSRRRTLLLSPGAHPLEECAAGLAALGGGFAPDLLRELRRDERSLHLAVLQALADDPEADELLVVVDQFEEVFTVCRDRPERSAFIAALHTAARAENSRTRVVLGVRSDFYAHCTEHPGLVEALHQAQLLVGAMTTEQLRRVVSQPAADVGATIESALLARLVADATGQASVLPLVSHALRETWSRRRGNTLTLAGFDAAGGLHHALARTAEAVYTGLSTEQRELARRVFIQLVALGEGTDDTKRRVSRAQLGPGIGPVLDALTKARLVTVDLDTVELTHEALLHAWPRLRDWVDQDRAGLLLHQRLADSAMMWDRERQDPGQLYRGGRLAVATDWAKDHPGDAPAGSVVARFLEASRRQESRSTRLRTAALVFVSVLALVASGAAAVALQQRSAARADLHRAVGTQTTVEGEQVRTTDVSLSAQLSLAASRIQPTPQTYTDLLSTEHMPLATTLSGYTATVYGVGFRADGKLLATGDGHGDLRLWNLSDPSHPAPYGDPVRADPATIYWVAFSPDGKTLATAGRNGTVRLWNVTDPAHPMPWGPPLTGHQSMVFSVAFSPDGKTLVSASNDHTIGLWNVTDPAHAMAWGVPVSAGAEAIASAEFSPDGHFVVTSGHDGTIGLWNVTDPARPARAGRLPVVEDGTVYATAFSPDGHILAGVSSDHEVRLFDVTDPLHPAPIGKPLAGHDDTVYAVAFSPDGRVLATAGADQGIRLWNVTDPTDAVELGDPVPGHTGYVYWLAFSPGGELASAGADGVRLWHLPSTVLPFPDYANAVTINQAGNLLAGAGTDGTIQLWNLTDPARPTRAGPPLRAHTNAVVSLAFDSRRPSLLASGGRDRVTRLWDAGDPGHPRPLGQPLPGGTAEVTAVTFDPGRPILATADYDGTVRLWDVTDPARPRPSATVQAGDSSDLHAVRGIAFSPDGRTLATVGADDAIRLWNITDPARPVLFHAPLSSRSGGLLDVAFSPDGRTLATAGEDHTVRLWNVTRPAPLGPPLTGHTSFVYTVAFSPDGRTLASGSDDHTVRLWDVTDPARAGALGQPLVGHTATVNDIAVGADGVLASAGDDHTVQLTLMGSGQAGRRICAATGSVLDRPRWRQYIPELPYDPPCPAAR
jgi:WD40 repeat protein